VKRSYHANALAATNAAAADDDDRNYIHINLSELVILFMIRSGKYPHAYRDYSDNGGSTDIVLLFAKPHGVIPEDPSLHGHISCLHSLARLVSQSFFNKVFFRLFFIID
jgi:hypothetical protein